jgi:alpha-D-ribose 1-methylphosphonate 5-triphosphate synthase subunit PhnH
MSAGLALGFADPVFDAQRVFRSVMNALSRPGSVQSLGLGLAPPTGLPLGLAAIALTLADHEAALWLDGALSASREAADYLRFHTGAAIVEDPKAAAFALVADPLRCPPFERFQSGTPEYPDRSTTIVFAAETLRDGAPLTIAGPGISATALFAATPRPEGFATRSAANRALFPCGVDLLFATASEVVGLPRTTRILDQE